MIASPQTLNDYRHDLHISKSQVKTFLMCPQRYAFQYVEGREWKKKTAPLSLGTAIHEAVAEHYKSLMNKSKPLTLAEIQDVFIDSWEREINGDTPVEFNNGDRETITDLGKQMLKVFIENTNPRQIEAVELPFSVPISDPQTEEVSPVRLVGAFDLIEADEDGNRIISELKTSAKKWTDGQIETALDSAIYSYAFKEMGCPTNGGETLVRFDVLVKTKKPSLETYYTSRGEKDHRKMLSLFSKVLHAIENGSFYPVSGWQCASCPFKEQCEEET